MSTQNHQNVVIWRKYADNGLLAENEKNENQAKSGKSEYKVGVEAIMQMLRFIIYSSMCVCDAHWE
jgi:hypothetical protein